MCVYRENDRHPIWLEDPFIEQLINAAESVPYNRITDVPDMYSAMYSDCPDTALTTPDHMTTSSEPDGMESHIAQPERAFSEDSMDFVVPDIRIQEPTASVSDEQSLNEEDAMLAHESMDHYVTATRPNIPHVLSAYDNVLPDDDSEENMTDDDDDDDDGEVVRRKGTLDFNTINDIELFIDEDDFRPARSPAVQAVMGGDTDSFSSAAEDLADLQTKRSAKENKPAVLDIESNSSGHHRASSAGFSSGSDMPCILDLSDDRESQELNSDDLKESAYV